MSLMVVALLAFLTACGAGTETGTEGTNFPDKRVTIVVPWNAGGGGDQVARALAPIVEEELGQTVTVTNITGGSGAVGFTEIHNADPDGYTIGIVGSSISTLKPVGSVPFNSSDFEPIIAVNYDPAAIIVKDDAPWQTVDELIEDAKANPGEILMGTSGTGGIWYLASLAFELKTGTEFNIIPDSGGAAPNMVKLLGGHVDVVAVGPNEAAAQLESGDARILALMGPERMEAFPDAPTMLEAGHDVEIISSRGFLAPKGTPREVIEILHDAFSVAVESEHYQEFIKNSVSNALNMDPDTYREFLAEDDQMFDELIRELGLDQQ